MNILRTQEQWTFLVYSSIADYSIVTELDFKIKLTICSCKKIYSTAL